MFGMFLGFGMKSAPFLVDNWSRHPILRSSHVTRNMGYTRFRTLLSNLHFSDDNDNVPAGHPGHDNIHKIRHLISMVSERFVY